VDTFLDPYAVACADVEKGKLRHYRDSAAGDAVKGVC